MRLRAGAPDRPGAPGPPNPPPARPAQLSCRAARVPTALDAPADAFVALPGWGRGLLWLNGFLLGRYTHEGPQRTLYAPGPLWHAGGNELVVLELETHAEAVELRDHPDLGPTAAAPSVDY
ncbi:hypothetical protein [Kitasatospora sp. NPDC050467]|uniref:hypothetical protein n=1 Tax=unclassified Kitasatospora TaxID=2633591 RepID=UPI0037A64217